MLASMEGVGGKELRSMTEARGTLCSARGGRIEEDEGLENQVSIESDCERALAKQSS